LLLEQLHRDVSMCAAERLIAVIAEIRCNDPDIQMRLLGLRRELVQSRTLRTSVIKELTRRCTSARA
jgi:hypothetical protein